MPRQAFHVLASSIREKTRRPFVGNLRGPKQMLLAARKRPPRQGVPDHKVCSTAPSLKERPGNPNPLPAQRFGSTPPPLKERPGNPTPPPPLGIFQRSCQGAAPLPRSERTPL